MPKHDLLFMVRVMIADDSDDMRQALGSVIQMGNHELVAEASDGMEAMEKFMTTNPDVLLLDVTMPKKDGLTVLKEIIMSKPNAKIIMLTGNEDLLTIHKSSADGAQAYLMKPFDIKDVLDAITMVVS